MTGRSREAAAALERRSSRGAEATEQLGETLAASLDVGDVVALEGPLGAGKTRFVMGLARGLQAATHVRSPTFTLVNEYRGRLLLLHADLYRVEPGGIPSLGLEELRERGALVVEWGEKLPAHLLADALRIEFEVMAGDERALTATAARGRALELLEVWRAMRMEA